MVSIRVSEVKQVSPNRPYYKLYWENEKGETGGFSGKTKYYKSRATAEKAGKELAKKLRANF